MFVNKYTIVNSELSGTTGYDIKLPVTQNTGNVGQRELIESKFIETEVDKAVNIIYDYEKVKLLPKIKTPISTTVASKVLYKVDLLKKEGVKLIEAYTSSMSTKSLAIETLTNHNLNVGDEIVIACPLSNIFNSRFKVERLGLDDGSKKDEVFVIKLDTILTTSNLNLINTTIIASESLVKKISLFWSDIDFVYDDFLFKRKSFTKTFLRLDFYDSDIATNQKFISFITLYPKFSNLDIMSAGQGNVPHPETYGLSFELGNTMIDRDRNGEGFSLYHFKDEILPDPLPPKNLYMKARFNNAKTGISTGLMSSSNPNLPIDELMQTTMNSTTLKNNLYTRYILTRDEDGYFYEIDPNYSNNVIVTANKYEVQFYETSTM